MLTVVLGLMPLSVITYIVAGAGVFPGLLLLLLFDLTILRILLGVLLPAYPLYAYALFTPHHLVQDGHLLRCQKCGLLLGFFDK